MSFGLIFWGYAMLALGQRPGCGFGGMSTAWRNSLSGAMPGSSSSGATNSSSRCGVCGSGLPTPGGNLQLGSNFGQYGSAQGQQAQQQQMLGAMMQIMQVLMQLMQQMGQHSGQAMGQPNSGYLGGSSMMAANGRNLGQNLGASAASQATTKQVPKTINDFKLPDEPLGSSQLRQMTDFFAQRAGVTTDGLQQAQGQMFAAQAQRSIYGY